MPKVQVDARNVGGEEEYKKKAWGNGRDWNFPPPREGGWVRIWPLKIEMPTRVNNNPNNTYVKNMVNKVKFNLMYYVHDSLTQISGSKIHKNCQRGS